MTQRISFATHWGLQKSSLTTSQHWRDSIASGLSNWREKTISRARVWRDIYCQQSIVSFYRSCKLVFPPCRTSTLQFWTNRKNFHGSQNVQQTTNLKCRSTSKSWSISWQMQEKRLSPIPRKYNSHLSRNSQNSLCEDLLTGLLLYHALVFQPPQLFYNLVGVQLSARKKN